MSQGLSSAAVEVRGKRGPQVQTHFLAIFRYQVC